MGRAGRERVRKEFPVENMVRRTAEVYKQLKTNSQDGRG
jgi:hypothetical protein